MSIRRFRILEKDAHTVQQWLKGNKTITKDVLPGIVWAHKAPLRLHKGAHGKHVLQVQENEVWKRVLHEGEIDGYLREQLLSSKADVPMSRDAGYHITQKRCVGISRRAFMRFLQKQSVLQITRDALPKKKNVGRPPEARGNLEMDLVEAKGKDIGKFVGHAVKNFYWITLIDRLTGWLEVKRIITKDFKRVVPALRTMMQKMRKALKTDVKYVRSDSGSEFKSETKAMLQELGIRHRFVKSGARLEQANKTFQKIWYRLMRLQRGDLAELDAQAVAIFNNTISKVNGRTPLEALDVSDQDLASKVRDYKLKQGRAKYKVGPLQKGDKVRILLDSVRGKHKPELGYKSYRGKHWTQTVYSVVKFSAHRDQYYVASAWYSRDKLLHIPGVDAITDAAIAKKRSSVKEGARKAGFEW